MTATIPCVCYERGGPYEFLDIRELRKGRASSKRAKRITRFHPVQREPQDGPQNTFILVTGPPARYP